MTTVAIIEDDLLASMALKQLLEEEGFEVATYASTDEAYSKYTVSAPDLVIADWCVPGEMSSHQLIRHLREVNPLLRVVFISGYDPQELRDITEDEPWMSFLSKPIPFDLLIENVKCAEIGVRHLGPGSESTITP